jgi:hypothetical protein
MNRFNIAIALIASIILLTVGHAQTGAQGLPGRWQLFTGEHWAGSGKSTVEEKEILRIDTQTGDTSVWRTGIDASGKYFNTWTPIAVAK